MRVRVEARGGGLGLLVGMELQRHWRIRQIDN